MLKSRTHARTSNLTEVSISVLIKKIAAKKVNNEDTISLYSKMFMISPLYGLRVYCNLNTKARNNKHIRALKISISYCKNTFTDTRNNFLNMFTNSQ